MAGTKRIWEKADDDPFSFFTIEFEVDPRSTALIVIDMQKFLCCQDIGLGKFWNDARPGLANYWFSRLNIIVVPNIRQLLTFFRDNKLRIIYIRGGPLLPDASDTCERRRNREEAAKRLMGLDHLVHVATPEYEIIDELKPLSGELIIDKNSASAFNSTNIDQLLRNMGIKSLVLAGIGTNACVETTSRDAADLGYNCILVEDACATIQGQEVHDMTMRNFAELFGKVMFTSEVLECLHT